MRVRKVRFSDIAGRITGVSTPFFGISWIPPESERGLVGSLITFLEDRRALYYPYAWEEPAHVVESILGIRRELTTVLQELNHESEAAPSLRAMQAACRKFLDVAQRVGYQRTVRGQSAAGNWWEGANASCQFFTALGELRGVFGIHIALLCTEYGIDLDSDLAMILPAGDETGDSGGE